jgi:excisionase family DNA binding protein
MGALILKLDNLPDIMTRKQLSEFLKVSDLTIFRVLKSGELKGFRVGRHWRIEKEAVLQWLNTSKYNVAQAGD